MTTDILIIVAVGIGMVTMGALATFKEGFATNYVRSSAKAWIWRKMLGEERAVTAVQRVFGPIAIGLGITFMAIAIWLTVMA
jgi:hypothetical protein